VTTIAMQLVRCGVCGTESEQTMLASTSSLGPPDLDMRPAPPARETLFAAVQRCPSCGFCAPSLEDGHEELRSFVEGDEYRETLELEGLPELARSFLCAALVLDYVEREGEAGWAAIEAAWVCDDEGAEDGARFCRARAIDLFAEIDAAGDALLEDDASEAAVRADVLRRARRFGAAADVAMEALARGVDDDFVSRVLEFEVDLAAAEDDGAHSVEEIDDRDDPPPGGEPSALLGPRFEEALLYATRTHALQRRKGSAIPYVSHLLAVCALVLEDGGDESEAIAALLHDAAEDQGGEARLDDIRLRFGDDVAGLVEECSDTLVYPKPPWPSRKEHFVQSLAFASPAVARISLADKLHNAGKLLSDYRAVGEDLWQRFDPLADELWYFASLVNVFREVAPGPLASQFERTVSELDEVARVGALRTLLEHGERSGFEGQHVIFHGDEERNYYVQFAVDEGGLFCEAVYNYYLEPENHLTGDQVARLLALGWSPPEDEEQNFFRIFQPTSDEDLRAIVALARRAFIEVYGLPEDAPIGLSTSWRPRSPAVQGYRDVRRVRP
jgi:hypothetical protein